MNINKTKKPVSEIISDATNTNLSIKVYIEYRYLGMIIGRGDKKNDKHLAKEAID